MILAQAASQRPMGEIMSYVLGPTYHPDFFEQTKAFLEFDPFQELNFEFEPWEFITEAIVQELDEKARFLYESTTALYPVIEGEVVREEIRRDHELIPHPYS